MNDELKQVFEIVNATLNHEIYQKKVENIIVYKYARENGFSGMVFVSLMHSMVEPTIYHEFQRDHYQYKQRDILQKMVIEEINQLFNAHKINHLFLKGAFLKTIYPESYMRSMGDIDVLVDENQMHLIHQLLPKFGYLLHSKGPSHDVFVKDKSIDIEIHPDIDTHFDGLSRIQFANIWEKQEHYKDYEYRFYSEYQILYLLSHLVKHLKSSGIGLRQVLDVGLYFKKYELTINQVTLNNLLMESNLLRFFHTVLWLNVQWFGFQYDYKYNKTEMTEELLDEITAFMSISGVHGKGNEFNRALPALTKHALGSKGSKGSKMRYLLTVGFPKLSEMQGTKPYLKKYPILLPYAWVSRWFYLVFRKGNRTKNKLKNMNIDNIIIEKQALLYKKMGL